MRIAAVGVALVLALLLGLGVWQSGPFLAYRRLQDLAWLRTASPTELRATAHEALAFRLGDPHDAFGVLTQYGDRSSIAVLRAALTREPWRNDGSMDCTWQHAHHALERALKLPP